MAEPIRHSFISKVQTQNHWLASMLNMHMWHMWPTCFRDILDHLAQSMTCDWGFHEALMDSDEFESLQTAGESCLRGTDGLLKLQCTIWSASATKYETEMNHLQKQWINEQSFYTCPQDGTISAILRNKHNPDILSIEWTGNVSSNIFVCQNRHIQSLQFKL